MRSPAAGRIVGVDVARGLAVLGMFAAHVGHTEPFEWSDPATWSDVVNGRSSILFALLAGVSLAILTGREHPVSGAALSRARVRILVRALVLFGLGMLLTLPETNVAVILHYYAVYFVLALPFLRVPPAVLLPLALAIGVVMPIVLLPVHLTFGEGLPVAAALLWDLLAAGYYPALIWIAFVLAGLGIGRLRLGSPRVQWSLLGAGTALAALAYGAGALLGGEGVASLDPHSGTPFEVVGSGGFAIAVLGACLLLSRVIRPLLVPVAAVGSMALTAYTGQLLAIAVFRVPVPGQEGSLAWLWFMLAALTLCTVWALLLGRGPLERGLSWLSNAAAGPRQQVGRD